MNTKKEVLQKCPKCGKDDCLRVNVFQDVDVVINSDGEIKTGDDYSTPDIDDSGKCDCTHCGIKLRTSITGKLVIDTDV